jgi:hypothetical protein
MWHTKGAFMEHGQTFRERQNKNNQRINRIETTLLIYAALIAAHLLFTFINYVILTS